MEIFEFKKSKKKTKWGHKEREEKPTEINDIKVQKQPRLQ